MKHNPCNMHLKKARAIASLADNNIFVATMTSMWKLWCSHNASRPCGWLPETSLRLPTSRAPEGNPAEIVHWLSCHFKPWAFLRIADLHSYHPTSNCNVIAIYYLIWILGDWLSRAHGLNISLLQIGRTVRVTHATRRCFYVRRKAQSISLKSVHAKSLRASNSYPASSSNSSSATAVVQVQQVQVQYVQLLEYCVLYCSSVTSNSLMTSYSWLS
jgi:hypothetical protein